MAKFLDYFPDFSIFDISADLSDLRNTPHVPLEGVRTGSYAQFSGYFEVFIHAGSAVGGDRSLQLTGKPAGETSPAGLHVYSLPVLSMPQRVSARASTTTISARVMLRLGASVPAEVPLITPAWIMADRGPLA